MGLSIYDSDDLEKARAEGYQEGLAAGRAEGQAAAIAQAAAAKAQIENAHATKVSNAREIMLAAVEKAGARGDDRQRDTHA